MSTIHFIGGEKGGVGKSVVARLVAQRCIDQNLPFVAFDADGSHGALLRHYANFASPIDLAKFESADQIMGAATDAEQRVVVDMPAQSERFLSSWINEAQILDLAAEGGVGVLFWHVIDDGKDSLTTLARLLENFGPKARFVIVKNHGRGRDFSLFDNSDVRRKAESLGATILELPALYAPVMQKIDQFDASYWAAAHNPEFAPQAFSRMDRQRLKVWLKAASDQFERLADSF
jgi:hypothetical protein